MATKLEAIVAGETFLLSDGAIRVHLRNEGFGLPVSRRLTERGPLQNGSTPVGYRIEPRTIKLMLHVNGTDELSYFQRRDELLYIFTPREEPIFLRFTKPDGSVRQIDAFYLDGLSLASTERSGYTHRSAISLLCPDPTWYNPVAETISFGIAAGAGAHSVPLTVPVAVGSSTLNQSLTVSYQGTWDSFPIITIQGPITSPIITNTVSGDKLDFTGTSIAGGETYTIDTRYGNKRVYRNNNPSDNQIGKLTADSDLATFRLLRKPDALGGNNSLTVVGSAANTTTQVFLSFNTRYIGV